MDRRDFLKILGVGGAGVGAGIIFGQATKSPGAKLIPYLIPPEDMIPGIGTWYAGVCRECPAGCGTLVKVMEGRAKKIEGNPNHPVNKGRLCAIGQASLQTLYNPDRIKGPLKRSGARGSGQYTETTWEEALAAISKNLVEFEDKKDAESAYLLTEPLRGSLKGLVSGFMAAYGSSNIVEYSLYDNKALANACRESMGVDAIPYYDIANTNYLFSFGADFSTTWLSPVNLSMGYGEMRQGEGRSARGRLVQVEPRLSATGMSADEWVPAAPGTEGILALSMAYAVIEKGLAKGSDSSAWRSLLSKYRPEAAASVTNVSAEKIYRLAVEFAGNRPSMAIAGDTMASYSGGGACIAAVNVLNHVAGNLGIQGGVLANPETAINGTRPGRLGSLASLIEDASKSKVKSLIIYNSNPVFTTPQSLKTKEALGNIPFIASFSSFMDETAVMADIILPSHTAIEDWGDDFPEPGPGIQAATISQPAVSPVFNTKGIGDIFLALAKKTGGKTAEKFAWAGYGDYLRDAWKGIYSANKDVAAGSLTFDDFWVKFLANGGWWEAGKDGKKTALSVVLKAAEKLLQNEPCAFDGDPKDFPFYLVLHPHTRLRDGSAANNPWLQEVPDPVTSVVWGSWVEINPATAGRLGIRQGDMAVIESPSGKITLPVYLYEGIRPDTVSIPVGQGHSALGRYVKDRDANPIDILPAKIDGSTGLSALNSTRVRVSPAGVAGRLAKFEATGKELGRDIVKTMTPAEFRKTGREAI